ncbi:MAG: PKD domain-containing protein [Bacteroidia bacterium]|nr:PKD domain-containing protein [Bacteroidia bacterium]
MNRIAFTIVILILSNYGIKSQIPLSNFYGTNIHLCEGDTVHLIDNSQNSPTSWQWIIASNSDTVIFYDQDPIFIPAPNSLYTVTLITTNSFGSDTFTRINYIDNSIYAQVSTGNNGYTANLYNYNGQYIEPVSYAWSLNGDSSIYNASTFPFLLLSNNCLNVIITDMLGCNYIDSWCLQNYWFANSLTDSIICQGVEITLQDPSTNNPNRWEWTFIGPDTLHSTAQNPTILFLEAGSYTVSLNSYSVNSTNEYLYHSPIVILPNSQPYVSIELLSNSFCYGDTALLTIDSSISGNTLSYQWFLNGDYTGISSDTYTTVLIMDTNYIYATMQSNEVCSVSNMVYSDSINVVISSRPNASFTMDTINIPLISFDGQSSSIGINYSWTFGDSTLNSIAPNPVHQYTSDGFFTVCLTISDLAGCQDDTCQVININSFEVGNSEEQTRGFFLFPNPAQNFITIQSQNNLQQTFSISNSMGEVVYKSPFSKEAKFFINQLEDGVYWVKVGNKTERLIILR